MNRRLEKRRAEFQQYKKDVRERGKPFYPYAMFHDTVMSLFVVSMIVALASIWKVTADAGHDPLGESGSGWLGRLYHAKADPGTTNFVPRPDWYFYFLFYLLRIFKWPDTVILGTVGVPTIALMLLLALPFIDKSRERRPLRRPVAMVAAVLTVISMGTLTYKGATAAESLASENVASVPQWAQTEGCGGRANVPKVLDLLRLGQSDQKIAGQTGGDVQAVRALHGAYIFAVAGCMSCHTYLGKGSSNLGAPDMSAAGKKFNRGVDGFATYIADPSKFGNRRMPKFGDLGKENLQALGTFLEASKGPK